MGSLKLDSEALAGLVITAFTVCLVVCACGALCTVYCITKKIYSAMDVLKERSGRNDGGVHLAQAAGPLSQDYVGVYRLVTSTTQATLLEKEEGEISSDDYYSTVISPTNKKEVAVELNWNDAYGVIVPA